MTSGLSRASRFLDAASFLPELLLDYALEETGSVLPWREGAEVPSLFAQRSLAFTFPANGGPAYVMWGIEGRPTLVDWSTYGNLRAGDVVWLRIEDLGTFVERVLPTVREPFVLVTGESDYCVPGDFPEPSRIVGRHPLLARWFTTNFDGTDLHDVVTPLPLGQNFRKKTEIRRFRTTWGVSLDFARRRSLAVQERSWADAVAGAAPVEARIPKAFADFWLNDSSRARRYGESRGDIHRELRDNPHVVFPPRPLSQTDLLATYARHAFVVSPHGRGLDCYRTWEALLAGCIVIVKRSALAPLYEGLPVVIVDAWNDIDASAVASWIARFGRGFDRARLREVLSMGHWSAVIGAASERARQSWREGRPSVHRPDLPREPDIARSSPPGTSGPT
ncbi:MAG: hypothetical protein U0169_22715 [Polyangiaceae bacterium]